MPDVVSTPHYQRITNQQVYEGPGTDMNSTTNHSLSWTDQRTSSSVPGWKDKIRRAVSATSTLNGSKRTVEYSPGLILIRYWNGSHGQVVRRYVSGCLDSLVTTWPPDDTLHSTVQAQNQALMTLVSRAREQQTTFQGGVALGELRETLRMIRNPAQSIRRGLDDFLDTAKKRVRSRPRSGKRVSDAKATEIIGGTWLEFAFGWQPLLNDIDAGAKALAKRRHEFVRETVPIRAEGRTDIETKNSYAERLAGFLKWKIYYRTNAKTQVIFKGAVKREVVNERATTREIMGFKPRDYLPTLWELIPYSFLVDYFTNIQEVVSAFAYHRSNFAWLQRTLRTQSVRNHWCVFDLQYAKNEVLDNAPSWYWLDDAETPLVCILTRSSVSRAQYTGSLVPTIEFEIPGLTSKKWLNLLALKLAHRDAVRSIAQR